MFVVNLVEDKIVGVKLERNFFGKNKRLVFIKSESELKGKKAVFIVPSDSINRDRKMSGLLSKLDNLGLKVVGSLVEPLVLYRLLKDEINDEGERLIINIGEKKSYIYKLNKLGQMQVLPEPINTSEIIPKVQELIGKEHEINKGFYFGVKSLSFDKDLFEKQTGISLASAEGVLRRRLEEGKVSFPIDKLGNLVPIASAVLLFDKKEIVKEKKFASLFLISVGVALIVAGLVIAGWRLIILPGKTAVKEPIPTIKPTIAPTPTPILKINPEDIRIKILNGSGMPGQAGKLAGNLKNIGFEVLETGNADRFDYKKTEVHYKKGEKQKADFLIKNLTDYKVGTPEASLKEDNSADVEIIIGEKSGD
jgi:hypothetical protein